MALGLGVSDYSAGQTDLIRTTDKKEHQLVPCTAE